MNLGGSIKVGINPQPTNFIKIEFLFLQQLQGKR